MVEHSMGSLELRPHSTDRLSQCGHHGHHIMPHAAGLQEQDACCMLACKPHCIDSMHILSICDR